MDQGRSGQHGDWVSLTINMWLLRSSDTHRMRPYRVLVMCMSWVYSGLYHLLVSSLVKRSYH